MLIQIPIPILISLSLLLPPSHAHAAADTPGVKLTLGAATRNATTVERLHGRAVDFIAETFPINAQCYGYTTRGPAVIARVAGLSDLDISAPGATVLLVQIDGGNVVADCGAKDSSPVPRLRVKNLASAKKITVYAGSRNHDDQLDYEIRIEDPKRPVQLEFSPNVPRLKLSDAPRAALVQTVVRGKSGGAAYEPGCEDLYFQKQPDLLIEAVRAIPDIAIDVHTAQPVRLLLVGPYGKDGRPPASKCTKQTTQTFSQMLPGLYALWIGTTGAPTVAHVAVLGKKSTRDPLVLGQHIPKTMPLGERLLRFHFPLLRATDIWDSDEVRQHLFDVAPRSLFVFAKQDFNDVSAYLDARLGEAGAKEVPADAKVQYPKDDEALLLISENEVLTADGNVFRVETRDLEEAASADPVLPARARNSRILFNYAIGAPDGNSDEKTIFEFWKRDTESKGCGQKIWDPVAARIKALRAGGYSDKREEQIRTLEAQTKAAAERVCGALEKRKKDVEENWIKTRTERRNAALAKLSHRFETLFVDEGN